MSFLNSNVPCSELREMVLVHGFGMTLFVANLIRFAQHQGFSFEPKTHTAKTHFPTFRGDP